MPLGAGGMYYEREARLLASLYHAGTAQAAFCSNRPGTGHGAAAGAPR